MDQRVMLQGNIAIAEGAIQAGCRYYFGYPITPQNDIPEHLSAELPRVGGVFIQAESEIASINMVLGAAAAGARVMTSSSGPGISLMQEGLSYLAGSELPAVVVNITRTGPGLGGIAPTQGDYKQAVRGGGHGDYYTIVLAPNSVQEMYDLTIKAFELADKYRNPAIVLGDAILGQMKEPVARKERTEPELPDKPWTLTGASGRKAQRIKSLYLKDGEMERHNLKLQRKYQDLARDDTLFEEYLLDDADFIVVSFGSCSRIALTAIDLARDKGMKVGLLRPITLFPFPRKRLDELSERVKRFLVAELNTGQMVDDVRLSVRGDAVVDLYARPGGTLPTPQDILAQIEKFHGEGS